MIVSRYTDMFEIDKKESYVLQEKYPLCFISGFMCVMQMGEVGLGDTNDWSKKICSIALFFFKPNSSY